MKVTLIRGPSRGSSVRRPRSEDPQWPERKLNVFLGLSVRAGPIYRLVNIFGRYRYIGICKRQIGHIGISIGICYSGYRLYWYQPNISKNIWISAKISAYIGQNTSYWQNIGKMKYINDGGNAWMIDQSKAQAKYKKSTSKVP